MKRSDADAWVDAWVDRLISDGTGIEIPRREPTDPLYDFEARSLTWQRGAHTVVRLERWDRARGSMLNLRPTDWPHVLRFALLRLSDLSMIAYRQGWRLKGDVRAGLLTDLNKDRLSPRREFTYLHFGAAPTRAPADRPEHRPSQADVLDVLRALVWCLEVVEMNRQIIRIGRRSIVALIRAVHPPIFLLGGSGTPAHEQLIDALRGGGSADYHALQTAMRRTQPAQ